MSGIIIERGKRYPLPIGTNEGASAQFLVKCGSILQIVLPGMSSEEEQALRDGVMTAGMLHAGSAILLLFQFYTIDGRPALALDCPFDLRFVPADRRNLPSTKSLESRLMIEVHGIDEAGILRALRGVSLSPELTREFFAAVMNQLSNVRSGSEQHELWGKFVPVDLMKLCNMTECGR